MAYLAVAVVQTEQGFRRDRCNLSGNMQICNRRTPIPELLLNGNASPSYSETIEDIDVKDILPTVRSV